MRLRRLVAPWVASPHRWSVQRKPEGGEGSGAGGAIEVDTTEEWLRGHVAQAVREGRQTKESAEYFESIMNDQAEFRQYVQEARRLMNNQDPRTLTKYQQRHFAERLSQHMSGVASERLMRAHAEESNARRHTQTGAPTGENYWFEAGNTLASPSVPGFVKDEVLREMREDRKQASAAFEESNEVQAMADKDEAFAQHLRRQRQRLLRSDDNSD
ncbi:uncharacterized protein Tco025E_01191 [Trypanosoma conorhini]|uniref:Uncharacterized protein n=1 Tax=Trypanosoma conorhini TaxID=83891 RepID=A0A422Q952_9TRYP|nr:uncharacterized protein Tco025E_01191 [Trypanosoma conorhini]RNF26469.1 hypothetical protein Tco025E_01191 [Trypanosoma conorhini]